MPDVRLIEVDVDTTAYDTATSPAPSAGTGRTSCSSRPARDIPTKESWETLLSRAGIGNGHHSRALRRQQQLVRRLRLLAASSSTATSDVRLMNGGRKKWEAEGRPTDHRAPQLAADQLPGRRARRRDPRLPRRGAAGARQHGATLVDVRSPASSRGEIIAPAGLPAGGRAARRPHPRRREHSLGAGRRTEDGTFKSADELRAALRRQGHHAGQAT